MSSKQNNSTLRPPPREIDLQFGRSWKVVAPSVYRYENSRWVDEFFESGKIRLSTFAKFATYPDEHRGDPNEGTAACFGETSKGLSFVVGQNQGINAAVLCCSHKLDPALKQAFTRDSAFQITNTLDFGVEIARQLPGFNYGIEGSCIYRTDVTIRRAINFDSNITREGQAIGGFDICEVANALGGSELLLLKRKHYEPQQEYRLMWMLDAAPGEFIDVLAPKARQFCRRIEDEEWSN